MLIMNSLSPLISTFDRSKWGDKAYIIVERVKRVENFRMKIIAVKWGRGWGGTVGLTWNVGV